MASGTGNDDTTVEEWPLADAELAFVAKHVSPDKRAEEVLLEGVEGGHIRWRCDNLTVHGDFQAYPALRTTFAMGRTLFWRRSEHSRTHTDWQAKCAVWMGPLVGFGSDGKGTNWPIFDPCASTSLTASLVRFHHSDIVNWLVTQGFTSPPAVSTAAVAAVEQPISSNDDEVADTVVGSTSLVDTSPPAVSTTAVAAVEQPISSNDDEVADSAAKSTPRVYAKQFIDQHPQLAGEDSKEYIDRLFELCGDRFKRKTLQNAYYTKTRKL